MEDTDFSFELTPADKSTLERAGNVVNGYRLVVDREATEFYGRVHLTSVPTSEKAESLALERRGELLENSRLGQWDDLRRVKVPDDTLLIAPASIPQDPQIMTDIGRGVVKNACLSGVGAKWYYAPTDFQNHLWDFVKETEISILVLDRAATTCYTDRQYEVLRDVFTIRQNQGRRTVFTFAMPFLSVRKSWVWPIVEGADCLEIRGV